MHASVLNYYVHNSWGGLGDFPPNYLQISISKLEALFQTNVIYSMGKPYNENNQR
jgi:hypothetical protein